MLTLNKLYNIDALQGLKKLEDNSVALCITSPPFLKMKKGYTGFDSTQYIQWILPICAELYRVMNETSSFILNINDGCEAGERSTYVFELVLELKKLGFIYFDKMAWIKTNGAPTSGKLRRSDYFEYIFQFTKSLAPIFNVDEIRIPYKPSSIKRAEKPIKQNVSNREGRVEIKYKKWVLNPLGAWPNNALFFKKDSGKTGHPAPFHISLPEHFIKAHSNPGDLILDPFAGKGTTLVAAKFLNRNFIGFELKKEYVDLAKDLYKLDVAY